MVWKKRAHIVHIFLFHALLCVYDPIDTYNTFVRWQSRPVTTVDSIIYIFMCNSIFALAVHERFIKKNNMKKKLPALASNRRSAIHMFNIQWIVTEK